MFLGRAKLGITDPTECRVFDEIDGTEIDDCLALCDNSRVYVMGAEWNPPPASSPFSSPVGSTMATSVLSPVTTISQNDAPPIDSVIIREAEGSGEISDSSIGGYGDWMDFGSEMLTSTPSPKGPSEDKILQQQEDTGQTSKDCNVRKRSLLEDLVEREIKKKSQW